MIDYIREVIDYNYKSILVPSLSELLKAYFYNHQDKFKSFINKYKTVDDFLISLEEYIITNNIALNHAIIKVLEID